MRPDARGSRQRASTLLVTAAVGLCVSCPGTESRPDPDRRLARAAVFYGACGDNAESTQSLLDRAYRTFGSSWESYRYLAPREASACLATRTDGCEGYVACTGVKPTKPGGLSNPRCDGNEAVYNLGGFKGGITEYRVDCTPVGATCVEGACSHYPDAPPCSAALDPAPHCETDAPVACDANRVTAGPNCGRLGLACFVEDPVAPGVPGRAFCRGTGAPCRGGSEYPHVIRLEPLRCTAGGRLEACVGGATADIDCGLIAPGFTCQSPRDGGVPMTPFCGAANECTMTRETCDGDSLVFCDGGRITRVKCTELGFRRCVDDGIDPAKCE